LIAAIDDGFAFIPFSILESPSISESHPQSEAAARLEIIQTIILLPGEKRFNEGMVDPAGRFLAGTMGLVHGTHNGRMFALVKGHVGSEPIKEGITCTNGMGWVDDGRTMYVLVLNEAQAI
jgi:sugar lactone lactonase YvrE